MSIATKNGSIIVKDGSVAENCNCCGGWYCFCDLGVCGLRGVTGATSATTATIQLSGIESANKNSIPNASLSVCVPSKPGEALNQVLCATQAARPWWANDGRGYQHEDLWLENTGAGFVDRTSPYPTVVVGEYRIATVVGRAAIAVGIVSPPQAANTGPLVAWGIKEMPACGPDAGEPVSVTLSGSAGDFGNLNADLLGGVSPPQNQLLAQLYSQGPTFQQNLGAFIAEYHWGYSLRNATATVTFSETACDPQDSSLAWWFATPFGSGGNTNRPPETIKVTLASPAGQTASRFAGEYTLELGKYVSGVDAAGNVITGSTHGSSYAGGYRSGFWVMNASVPRYVFVNANPCCLIANGVPCISWQVSINEQPKFYGWYGGDGYGTTDPVPYADNTSGTLSGVMSIAQYIGGGTLSISIEL